MDGGNGGERNAQPKGNRILWGVFGGLCVVIAGLVVGIVAVNLNQPTISSEVEEEFTNTNMSEEVYAEYNEFMDLYNTTSSRMIELLDEDPVNVPEIKKIYAEALESYIANKDYSKVQSLVLAEYEGFLSRDMEREALDSLIGIDYSYFPAPAQHRVYNYILELAQKLNDDDVIAKYTPLANETKEAYEESDEAIRKSGEKYREGQIVQERTQQ